MRLINDSREFVQLLLLAFPPEDPATTPTIEAIRAAVLQGRSILIGVRDHEVYISPEPEHPPRFLICDEQGEARRVGFGG